MRDPRARSEQILDTYQERTPLLFLGGLWVESEGSATIQVTNPANGVPIGRVPAANVRDVEHATREARRASEDWSRISPAERARALWQLADLVEAESEDLAILETLETGKTFREVLSHDVPLAIGALRQAAGWAGRPAGETIDLGGGTIGLVRHEPHPVFGAILAWDAPLATAARKIALPLAIGSSVVIKPPEQAPFAVLRLAELSLDAGLPPGVINVVTGFGGQAGESLALSPDVGRLGFSGSIETARRLLVSAAKSNLKEIDFDLGGKCAHLVFEDADVRRAVGAAWKAIFTARALHNTAGSRIIVHESIYESLATTMAGRAREMVLGDPLDEHTEMGPVISEEHMKRVLAYVELGRREGAKLVAGGRRDVDGTHASGFFVQPTVFVDVHPSMRIAREEIKGPVLSILPFRSEDQAVAIANDTDYGLAGAVWTQDVARAHRVAHRLKAGVVWVNQYGTIDPALPFGGVDLSGYGRDFGRIGLERASRTKTIYVDCR